MEPFPSHAMDTPSTYRICVVGGLESTWAERLWGMTATPVEQASEPEQTLLVGEVIDQAALVGILNALYNEGLAVLSVERVLSAADLHSNNTTMEA